MLMHPSQSSARQGWFCIAAKHNYVVAATETNALSGCAFSRPSYFA